MFKSPRMRNGNGILSTCCRAVTSSVLLNSTAPALDTGLQYNTMTWAWDWPRFTMPCNSLVLTFHSSARAIRAGRTGTREARPTPAAFPRWFACPSDVSESGGTGGDHSILHLMDFISLANFFWATSVAAVSDNVAMCILCCRKRSL